MGKNREEQAAMLHKSGCNCCQAVLCAYADAVGIDEATAYRMGEGFGSGMGTMEGTCGALSAAVMLAGLAMSNGDRTQPVTKGATMKCARALMEQFKHEAGAIYCREIKGVETGKVLYSCPDCVRLGARLAAEVTD